VKNGISFWVAQYRNVRRRKCECYVCLVFSIRSWSNFVFFFCFNSFEALLFPHTIQGVSENRCCTSLRGANLFCFLVWYRIQQTCLLYMILVQIRFEYMMYVMCQNGLRMKVSDFRKFSFVYSSDLYFLYKRWAIFI